MSKIQIAKLNNNASEFNTLNAQETAEVVGGFAVIIPTLTIVDVSTDANVGNINQIANANSFNFNVSGFGGGISSSNSNSQVAQLVQTNN